MAFLDPETASPLLKRKMRYEMLAREFGGSIFEWKRQSEREINFYLQIALIRARMRIMQAETNRMIGARR